MYSSKGTETLKKEVEKVLCFLTQNLHYSSAYIRGAFNKFPDFKDYINKPGVRLITVIRNNTDNTTINRTEITRKQKEGKQLLGHFK